MNEPHPALYRASKLLCAAGYTTDFERANAPCEWFLAIHGEGRLFVASYEYHEADPSLRAEYPSVYSCGVFDALNPAPDSDIW